MRVILGNNYFVDVDNLNWTLKKIVNVEEKEVKGKIVEAHDKETVIAYCKNFEQAVEIMLQHFQSDSGHNSSFSIREYAEFVSETNKSTMQAFCDIYEKGRE